MGKSLNNCKIIVFSRTFASSYATELLRQQGADVKEILLTNSKSHDEQIQLYEKISKQGNWNLVLIDCFDKRRPVFNDIPTIYIDFKAFQHASEEELQANSGWTAITGNDTSTIKIGGYPASILVAFHIVFLSVCQLLEQKQPFVIDVENILLSALKGKIEQVTTSNSSTINIQKAKEIVPMTIVPTKDGQIFIGAPSDEQWYFLTQWADLTIPNTSTNAERLKLKPIIYNKLAKWATAHNKLDLMDLAQSFRLPFASVQTHDEIVKCPQHQHRKFIINNQMSRSPWKGSVGLAASRPFCFTSFKQLQILDLTAMWAGPYCTRLFADLGAQVIKIEAPHRPDGVRGEKGMSPFFKELNRNKYSVALDLRNKDEKKLFLDLVKDSQIVINNFSPRVMENFQLTPKDLEKDNNSLIYASLSAFGQTGPYRNYIGYGSTLESMGGIVMKTTNQKNKPILPGFSISDITAGVIGAFAIALAIYEQQSFPTMRTIDVSQYEVATMIAWENTCKTHHKSKSLEEILADKASFSIEESENWWHQSNRVMKRLYAPILGEHNHFIKKKYCSGKEGVL